MTPGHVAVIDIGKTNAKLALVETAGLTEVEVATRPNVVRDGPPYPHFDVDGHWDFLLDALGRFHGDHGVEAIAITTHGAAAALIAADGSLAAPILDYEFAPPEESARAYDAIRPSFAETGSPRLSMGLNLGAQLFWQLQADPSLRDRVHRILTYPQFWAHRLTGRCATDVTSLGCHTDLWEPHSRRFSSLPKALGLADKIAAPRAPGELLGPILPEISQRTGLPAHIPVTCGIHDSNASLLPHLKRRKPTFSVVSTGTWVIAMAVGGRPVTLDPARDTLINVNALGDPVPSARFMGGREHDIALAGSNTDADDAQMRRVLEQRTMLLPAVIPDTGPFAGLAARWSGAEPAKGTGERSAAVGFYLALVTARCLELIGHNGSVLVEGPFARNRAFLWMLAAASTAPVEAMGSATGTSQGAALLCAPNAKLRNETSSVRVPDGDFEELLLAYARDWLGLLG